MVRATQAMAGPNLPAPPEPDIASQLPTTHLPNTSTYTSSAAFFNQESHNYSSLIASPQPFPPSQSKFASNSDSESEFQDLNSISETDFHIPSPNPSQISIPYSLYSTSSSSLSDTTSTPSQVQQDITTPSASRHQRTRHEISPSMASKIRALRHLAGLSYRSIAAKTHVSLSTVYQIGHLPSTPQRKSRMGRPHLLGAAERKKLITLATASASNRRKPLTEIALLAGIQASSQTLQRSFAHEGYHRRIARKKPFLPPKNKAVSYFFFLALFPLYFLPLYILSCFPILFSFTFFAIILMADLSHQKISIVFLFA